jgi:hypothetical protein
MTLLLHKQIENEQLANNIQRSVEGAGMASVVVIIVALMLGFMWQTLWGVLTTQ